jgi:type I restriction enzyme S subunit
LTISILFTSFRQQKNSLIRYASGGGQPNISQAIIKDFKVTVPPLSEQQEIAAYLDEKTAKIDKLIGELNAQLTELADYKQAVISEAVTGKVDVRNYRI